VDAKSVDRHAMPEVENHDCVSLWTLTVRQRDRGFQPIRAD
jgi:hypothetical protein